MPQVTATVSIGVSNGCIVAFPGRAWLSFNVEGVGCDDDDPAADDKASMEEVPNVDGVVIVVLDAALSAMTISIALSAAPDVVPSDGVSSMSATEMVSASSPVRASWPEGVAAVTPPGASLPVIPVPVAVTPAAPADSFCFWLNSSFSPLSLRSLHLNRWLIPEAGSKHWKNSDNRQKLHLRDNSSINSDLFM